MEVVSIIDKVMNSDQYKEWTGKDFYLAHLFRSLEEQQWQVGFYNPKEDRVVTFYVESDKVTRSDADEVFKQPDKTIEELNANTINIDWSEALKTAETALNAMPVTKTFFILQCQDGVEIYNITFLTKTLHTVNVQIDAQSGQVLSQKKESILEMASWEKGEKQE